MTENKLHLEIQSMDGTLFNGTVSYVSLPTTQGEITVLKGHMLLVTALGKGWIKFGGENIFIEGGTAEITNRRVKILAN